MKKKIDRFEKTRRLRLVISFLMDRHLLSLGKSTRKTGIQVRLAERFGVTRQYVHLLIQQERDRRKTDDGNG